jgi:DNA adenine methylase
MSPALTVRPAAPASPLRPPLKWAGGKRWLVPLLRPLWLAAGPSERRLVEPLCGGLAVALGLAPERALLNDINPHVINFYAWLRRGLTIDLPMRNERHLFYEHRRRFNELIANGGARSAEAAALFYYLNRTGYNGLCRFNLRGEFNVPFGRHKTVRYERDFNAYASLMEAWEFTAGDYLRVLLRRDDFVYADPPYDVEFTQYSKEPFDWAQQERLASWLASHPGPVVLSNQATERVVRLYQGLGYALLFVDAPRMISSDGNRAKAVEVIAVRNLALVPELPAGVRTCPEAAA